MTHLTESEIERIADRAAEKAVEKALQQMYVEIGRGVLRKAAYVVGIAIVALAMWLSAHGWK